MRTPGQKDACPQKAPPNACCKSNKRNTRLSWNSKVAAFKPSLYKKLSGASPSPPLKQAAPLQCHRTMTQLYQMDKACKRTHRSLGSVWHKSGTSHWLFCGGLGNAL